MTPIIQYFVLHCRLLIDPFNKVICRAKLIQPTCGRGDPASTFVSRMFRWPAPFAAGRRSHEPIGADIPFRPEGRSPLRRARDAVRPDKVTGAYNALFFYSMAVVCAESFSRRGRCSHSLVLFVGGQTSGRCGALLCGFSMLTAFLVCKLLLERFTKLDLNILIYNSQSFYQPGFIKGPDLIQEN